MSEVVCDWRSKGKPHLFFLSFFFTFFIYRGFACLAWHKNLYIHISSIVKHILIWHPLRVQDTFRLDLVNCHCTNALHIHTHAHTNMYKLPKSDRYLTEMISQATIKVQCIKLLLEKHWNQQLALIGNEKENPQTGIVHNYRILLLLYTFTRRFFSLPQYLYWKIWNSYRTNIEIQLHKYKDSQMDLRPHFFGRESREWDRAAHVDNQTTPNTLQ